MKLTHLRDVLAVAELGSLRAASRHLNIAQPAITRSIQEIESELGVPLFERHTKGVRLTDVGRAFVLRAQAVESEIRRAREEIAQLSGRATGQVSVALSTAATIGLLPAAMTAFRRRYPDAIVKVSEGFFQPVEADILSGRIDFYVGPLGKGNAPSQFSVERLFDNRRSVFARAGHALREATSLAELTGAKWILPTQSLRSTEGDFRAIFEREGLPTPNVIVHAQSALITLMVLANSDFLTVLPHQWAELPMFANSISPFPHVEPRAAAPICIVRRQDVPLTPMAEHFCDQIRRASMNRVSAP
jgi:LysR family transcriptional regulator of abg operon